MPFIILETKEPIDQYKTVIFDIIKHEFIFRDASIEDNKIIFFVDEQIDNLNDIILNLSEELYCDIRCYISQDKPLYELNVILDWLNNLIFENTIILDDKTLIMKLIEHEKPSNLKNQVLQTVYYDQELIKTALKYLEANQNMSEASKILYLHRNTLIQRLEKFKLKTGFDLRNFVDAYIIYTIIKI